MRLRRGHGRILVADDLRAGDRDAGRGEQLVRQLLVRGDVDAERARQARHRGPDPLLVDAVAELDERLVVQADRRDVAQRGLVEDGLRRRAERGTLGEEDELLELGAEVEGRLGLDEVVDEPHGELAGGDADALLGVRVDDVVPTGLTGAAGLAAADLGARLALELEGDVLGDVADPGALAQPIGESADAPGAAGVLADAGQHLEQRLGEAGDRVRREVLEHAEVDDELDRRVVVPVVRPAEDARLDDRQLGPREAPAGRWPRRARGGRVGRASWSLARLLDAAGAQRAPPPGALGRGVVGALGGDAADEASRAVHGGLDARELAIGRAHRAQRRHELALAEVEPIARTAASGASRRDHDRPMALDLVRIGADVRRVKDRDRSLAEHLHDALRADERGGVLVDADAEQGG